MDFRKRQEVTGALVSFVGLKGPRNPRIPTSMDVGIHGGSRNGTLEDNMAQLYYIYEWKQNYV